MKEWLVFATQQAIIIIDAMALIIIFVGTVEAFFSGMRVMFSSPAGHERRDVWLRQARWLIAGLTFQLAADIIETAITPSWEDIAPDRRDRGDPHRPELLSRTRPGRNARSPARAVRDGNITRPAAWFFEHSRSDAF